MCKMSIASKDRKSNAYFAWNRTKNSFIEEKNWISTRQKHDYWIYFVGRSHFFMPHETIYYTLDPVNNLKREKFYFSTGQAKSGIGCWSMYFFIVFIRIWILFFQPWQWTDNWFQTSFVLVGEKKSPKTKYDVQN